jgi:hypothetical protein
MTDFVYIVGLPVWGSMYGEFMPHTIKVFSTVPKAKDYMNKQNKKLNYPSYEIMKRKLN